ncbi:hypothetical protein ACNPNP_03085 [Microbacterium sp. AGC85]
MTDGFQAVPLTDETVTTSGIKRRTVVKASAWAVPVIAVAVATPLAAASTTTQTLEFTQPSYPGDRCGVLTGVQVRVADDGTAAAGVTVTVTLDDGYTFADGSTSHTGVTGASGLLTLPDINVPAAGGNTVLTATSGANSVSAPVTAPVAGGAILNGATGTTPTPDGLPIVDVAFFLDPAGNRIGRVLTTDGSIWQYNFETGAWRTAAVGTYPGAAFYDTKASGPVGGTIVAGGSSILNGLTGAVPTPNGLPILDATFFVDVDGNRIGRVLTSDNSVWQYSYETGAWSEITSHRMAGAAFYDYDVVNGSAGGIIASDSAILNGVTGATPPPNGLPILDATFFVDVDGNRIGRVLTSDNSVWQYNYETGAWSEIANHRMPGAEFYDYKSANGTFGGIIAGLEPC